MGQQIRTAERFDESGNGGTGEPCSIKDGHQPHNQHSICEMTPSGQQSSRAEWLAPVREHQHQVHPRRPPILLTDETSGQAEQMWQHSTSPGARHHPAWPGWGGGHRMFGEAYPWTTQCITARSTMVESQQNSAELSDLPQEREIPPVISVHQRIYVMLAVQLRLWCPGIYWNPSFRSGLKPQRRDHVRGQIDSIPQQVEEPMHQFSPGLQPQ